MILIDSCIWLEYLGDTDRADIFEAALEGPEPILVPSICIYEVFRKLLPVIGKIQALTCVAAMARHRIVDLDSHLAMDAAMVASEYRLPMADAVIYSTARLFTAELWTEDTHFQGLSGVKLYPKP